VVATRVELQCPNGHPKTLLVTLAFIRDEPETLLLTRVRCGVCGADFGLPQDTQEQLLAAARQPHEAIVSTTTV
jgi:hypothetical protein